jgi:hypothetical protein
MVGLARRAFAAGIDRPPDLCLVGSLLETSLICVRSLLNLRECAFLSFEWRDVDVAFESNLPLRNKNRRWST